MIWMKVKVVYVYVYTCCIMFKVHFHQIILQGSCIIYIKTGLCIFKSSLKSLNLLKNFKSFTFSLCKSYKLVSCSSLWSHLSKEKENMVHM